MPKFSKTGKIREKLYRLHAAAPKPKEQLLEVEELPTIFTQIDTPPVKSNVFKNIVIPPDALKQKLPSYSKKDKSNLEINDVIKNSDVGLPRRKKIPFHEVVTSAKEFLKKREKEKKKARTGILANFHALEEALPALDQLMGKKKSDEKPRTAKRFSKQDAEMMEDLQTYQQVLNNTQYLADPVGTITAQLRQRLQSGCL